jgi:hypothetical protein
MCFEKLKLILKVFIFVFVINVVAFGKKIKNKKNKKHLTNAY